jgi:hypothetical protein
LLKANLVTTVQRMTAKLRADMRRKRETKATAMLRQGATRAEVARTIGLSPSRVSAMFKGQTFPDMKKLRVAGKLVAEANRQGIYPQFGPYPEDED